MQIFLMVLLIIKKNLPFRAKNFITLTTQVDYFVYSVHTLLKITINIFVHIFDKKLFHQVTH